MGILSRPKKGGAPVRLEQFEMFVDPEDQGISEFLAKRAEKIRQGRDPGPEREPDFNWILRTELEALGKIFSARPDRLLVYDLGANLGLNTLIMDLALKINLAPEKYLIAAIEPQQKNAALLQKNISHNRTNARMFNCAISDYNGPGSFHLSAHSNLGALIPHDRTGAAQPVQVFTLPAFAEAFRLGPPNFIKMDIEGGEVEMLKGGREFLAQAAAPCEILMEVHPMMYREDRSLEHEIRFLFDHGWTAKYMVSAAIAQPDKFKAAGLEPFQVFETGRHTRGIYQDFAPELLLEFACQEQLQEIPGHKPSRKIVRAVLIEKKYQ